MPRPIHPDATDRAKVELVDSRSRPASSRAGRGMGVERLVLVLVTLSAALTLASDRFHLAVRNYDNFIIKQVIPASGLQNWLASAVGYDPSGYTNYRRAILGSPYYPEFDSEDGRILNATASDYLGIWYYTREAVSGRNPYAISRGFQLITHGKYPRCEWGDEVVDPGLPDQFVGILSYPPMGPFLILPFYLPNYFASFALYATSLTLFLLALGGLLVARSPGHRFPLLLLVLTLFLTSYPLGFLLDRGNIEGSVFILLACGLLAYGRGHHIASAVLIGLAASGKVVPAVFLTLFLLDGRFKALAVSLLTIGGATLIAMLCMHEPLGSVAAQTLDHMNQGKRAFVGGLNQSRFDHSLFSLLKTALYLYFPHDRASHLTGRLAPLFSIGILAWIPVILYFLRRLPFANRILVLTAVMLSFPQSSGDYKLIHLYIPFGLILLASVRRGWASPAEAATLSILCILFAPKTYQFGDYSLGYLINSSLLVGLIVIGLCVRFEAPDPEGSSSGLSSEVTSLRLA